MSLASILDQSRKSLGHVYDAGQLDWVPATASSGGGDGAILDGVSSSIKATVFDFTNSNPVAVTLRDTNGDAVSVGGGTQYVEDAAAAVNPTGTAVNLIRQDTPTGLVTTDGDNVTQRGTNFGAGFVQVLTSAGAFVDTFGGGTQYTEDAPAAADPIGTALNLVRKDAPSATVSADGDNIAARGSNFGAQYVTSLDSAGGFVSFASLAVVGGGTEATALRVTLANNSTGVVQANAGTNLNTSALALEAGNLATIAGAVRTEDVASSTGQTGMGCMVIQKATPVDTAQDGDYSFPQMSAGRMWVDASGVTLTVASHAVTNAGTFVVQENGSQVISDDSPFTPATTKVVMAGLEADETATDSVDEGDAGAARMTLDRKAIVTPQPHTQGGLTNFSQLSTAAVISAQIKGSVGQVYELEMFNTGAAAVFARLYDQVGAPASTDTANIVWRGVVPGTSGSTGAGFVKASVHGRAHATGIGIRVTAAVADNDNTSLNANQVLVNVGYK